MKITSARPDLRDLPVDRQIDAALMSMEKKQAEADGESAVKLIDSAIHLENRPLKEGPVGTRINIAA